jgi:hypothetical protein
MADKSVYTDFSGKPCKEILMRVEAGGPPIPAFSLTHDTVGAPLFAPFAKGGIPRC